MESIEIKMQDKILAHHTTDTFLSHYGQHVWIVENENPEPGQAIWKQGDNSMPIEVIEARGGWLICEQPDGLLCGIIWSDGTYHANLLVDANDEPAQEIQPGVYVRGTVQLDRNNPEDLGAIIDGSYLG